MVALGSGRARTVVSRAMLASRGAPSGIAGGAVNFPRRSTTLGPLGEGGGAGSASPALAAALPMIDGSEAELLAFASAERPGAGPSG